MTALLGQTVKWIGWSDSPDDEIIKYEYELHEPVDTILLGRKMTDGFISYWLDVMNKPDDPWYAFAKKLIDTPKVVFTKTLNKSRWINTDIATGDLIEEVSKIKSFKTVGTSSFMVVPHSILP